MGQRGEPGGVRTPGDVPAAGQLLATPVEAARDPRRHPPGRGVARRHTRLGPADHRTRRTDTDHSPAAGRARPAVLRGPAREGGRAAARLQCRHGAQHHLPLARPDARARPRTQRRTAYRGGPAVNTETYIKDACGDLYARAHVPADLTERILSADRAPQGRARRPLKYSLAAGATALLVGAGVAAVAVTGGSTSKSPAPAIQPVTLSSDTSLRTDLGSTFPRHLVAAGHTAVAAYYTAH